MWRKRTGRPRNIRKLSTGAFGLERREQWRGNVHRLTRGNPAPRVGSPALGGHPSLESLSLALTASHYGTTVTLEEIHVNSVALLTIQLFRPRITLNIPVHGRPLVLLAVINAVCPNDE